MAWYDDQTKTEFVGTYANEKQMQWDVDAAKRRGWAVQGFSAGNPEVSEAVIGAEGGSAPPFGGAARGKARITVTFVREADWLAQRKQEIANAILGTAAKAADAKEARVVKAEADLERAEKRFAETAAAAAVASDANREQIEREFLRDLREMIARRQTAVKALDDAIREMNDAVTVGASEFVRSVANHTKSHATSVVRLEAEQKLLAVQELVARAAKEWKDAGDRRRSAEEELRKRTVEYEAKDAVLYDRLGARNSALEGLGPLG